MEDNYKFRKIEFEKENIKQKKSKRRNRTPETTIRKKKINYKLNEPSGLSTIIHKLPSIYIDYNKNENVNSSLIQYNEIINVKEKNDYIDTGLFEYKLDKINKIIIPESYKFNNKTLKPCQKEKLPKEKSYLISQTNYELILSSLKDRENDINSIKQEKENLNNEIKECNRKYYKLIQENETLKNEKEDMLKKNTFITSNYSKLYNEFKKYELIYTKFLNLIKYIFELFPGDMRIKKKINELELKGIFINDFNGQIDENKNLDDLLTVNEKKLLEELEEKQKKIDDAEKRILELQNSTNNSTLKILSKNSSNDIKRIRELNQLNEKLLRENTFLKLSCQNLKNENDDNGIKQQVDFYIQEYSNLQRKNETLDLKNKKFESDINLIKLELNDKNNEIVKLKNEINEKNQNMILKENTINELNNQRNELERSLNNLKKENNNLIIKNKQKDSIENYMNNFEKNMNYSLNNNDNNNNNNNMSNSAKENEIKNLFLVNNPENEKKKNVLMNDLFMVLLNQSKMIEKNYREKNKN